MQEIQCYFYSLTLYTFFFYQSQNISRAYLFFYYYSAPIAYAPMLSFLHWFIVLKSVIVFSLNLNKNELFPMRIE